MKNDYIRLLAGETLNDNLESFKMFIDVAFEILRNHDKTTRNNAIDHDAFILFQMNVLRSCSICDTVNGFGYSNSLNNINIHLVDPFSSLNLTRALMEAYCNFNNIYIQSSTHDEKELKYNLWVISGLKYRQGFDTMLKTSVEKKAMETVQIQAIEKSIFESALVNKLSDESKKLIRYAVSKKKWQVTLTGKNVQILGWQSLLNNVVLQNISFINSLYTYLSLATHPSNVAVFQFAEIHAKNQESNTFAIAIRLAQYLLSFHISDYCNYFFKESNLFSSLPPLQQLLIDSTNKMFRGDDYIINKELYYSFTNNLP